MNGSFALQAYAAMIYCYYYILREYTCLNRFCLCYAAMNALFCTDTPARMGMHWAAR